MINLYEFLGLQLYGRFIPGDRSYVIIKNLETVMKVIYFDQFLLSILN
jgi:hypothetical protein